MAKHKSPISLSMLLYGFGLNMIFSMDRVLGDVGPEEFGLSARAHMMNSSLSSGVELLTLSLLVFLLLSILILGTWSLIAQKQPREILKLGLKTSVRHLFLAIQFKEKDNSSEEQLVGFLRTLGNRTASLVTPKPYSKGDQLEFSLSSLPDFPATDLRIDAVVVRCVSLGGKPASYSLDVRFLVQSQSVKDELARYIFELTKRRRYAYS